MNDGTPDAPLDLRTWHVRAEYIAQYVAARRGLAANHLFGRPLNSSAARWVQLRGHPAAQRRVEGQARPDVNLNELAHLTNLNPAPWTVN